ncbi:MAG: hypothetical protein PUP91_34570 [Rhizonema sp. PD37]|nr:hypothetical protein [Rhizonema sp. PD37]
MLAVGWNICRKAAIRAIALSIVEAQSVECYERTVEVTSLSLVFFCTLLTSGTDAMCLSSEGFSA